MTPVELLARFRRDVDDLDLDPTDPSDLLWSDEDIMFYMEEAQRRFVVESCYIHEVLELSIVEDQAQYDLAAELPRFYRLRGDRGFLRTAGTFVVEHEMTAFSGSGDDYGQFVQSSPFVPDADSGRPRSMTFDLDNDSLTLFPTPDADDTLELPSYVEPVRIEDTHADAASQTLAISNTSHQVLLLHGMKAMAYQKQDADVYDPNQAERWEQKFADAISNIKWERMRRRRNPGTIRYGGI